jgi:hypothetical protein
MKEAATITAMAAAAQTRVIREHPNWPGLRLVAQSSLVTCVVGPQRGLGLPRTRPTSIFGLAEPQIVGPDGLRMEIDKSLAY